MIKSLFVLMLIASQFVAANRENVYLCISNDGNHFSLHVGSESCNCCHHDDKIDHGHKTCTHSSCGVSSSHPCCQIIRQPCGDSFQTLAETSPQLKATSSCECTHLLISAKQLITVAESSKQPNRRLLSPLWTCEPAILEYAGCSVIAAAKIRLTSPPISSGTLGFLATIALRC